MTKSAKSILIVTEIFDIGGLETHIRGEINQLSKLGWQVHLACGKCFMPDLVPQLTSSITSGLALGPEATLSDLVATVRMLKELIEIHDIEVVHAHPFTALFPSLIAAELTHTPLVISLHGPASLGAFYGPYYDFLLNSIILPGAELVVAVSEEVRALAAPYVRESALIVQHNAVPLDEAQAAQVTQTDSRWLIVSRLDAFKIVGIREFILFAQTAGIPGVVVAGDGPARELLHEQLTKDGLLKYVELMGMRADIPALMRRFSGVAGMGRVVLEGIASERPVCLVGYDGVKGFLDSTTFIQAAESNFSGRNFPNISFDNFSSQLLALESSHIKTSAVMLGTLHDEAVVWSDFSNTADQIKTNKPSFATDLYAWIQSNVTVDDNTPYLLSIAMHQAIGRLAHSHRYSGSAILPSYLHYERLAEHDAKIASLNQVIVERNEQITTLNQAVEGRNEQITNLNQAVEEINLNQAGIEHNRHIIELNRHLSTILRSRSWRLTKPFRFLFRTIRNAGLGDEDKAKFLLFCRTLYRRLPLPFKAKYVLRGIFFRITNWPTSAMLPLRNGTSGVLSPTPTSFSDYSHMATQRQIKPYFGVRRLHGKRRAAILTNQLLDWKDGRPRFGGGERYALELAHLLTELSLEVTFFQPSLLNKTSSEYYSFEVRFLPVGETVGEFHYGVCTTFTEITVDFDHVYYHLPEYASGEVREDGLMTCHGIWFDHNNYPDAIFRTAPWFEHLYRSFRNPIGVISVDTNSIGVIRSLWPELAQKMRFIPNFFDKKSYYPDFNKRNSNRLTVLFPRRSQINRGSRIFADIVSAVPYDVEIIWLGEGDPVDTQMIKDVSASDKRVSFRVADFDQMPSWYQRADIAVIPTIACEGTSLSCIEALACGCAVIATNVGGLPDVIYDGINGLLVEPNPIGISNAINKLIEDHVLREKLQRVGSETAHNFELTLWRARWVELLWDYGWINDQSKGNWLMRNPMNTLASHSKKADKWVILTRNAIHGGVESIIREESRLLNAPVIVCGGHDKKETCPFEYTRADNSRVLEKAIINFDVILYHWLPDWALEVIKKSKKTSIEFIHRTDTSNSDKTVPAILVTHSTFLANYIYQSYGRSCRVLDHPITLDRFVPDENLGNCIGAITSYYEIKGIDIFLRAWALLKGEFGHVPVRFYGAGDDLHKFKALASELDIDVDFREATPEPWKAMKEFQCFVVPSRIEGLPIAVLEALAMDVPVIATALPGMIEFNELSSKRGYESYIHLALPENPEDLAKTIRATLLGGERKKSSTYISEYYSPNKHCSDLIDLLREVCRH